MAVHPARYRRAEQVLIEELGHILAAYDAVVAVDEDDDDVFLVGAIPLEWVDSTEMDRLIGTAYATVEAHFPTAMGIGHDCKRRAPLIHRYSTGLSWLTSSAAARLHRFSTAVNKPFHIM